MSNAVNSATTSILLSMSNGLYFVPVQPCRLVDTRWPNSTYGGPFYDGESKPEALPFASARIQTAPTILVLARTAPIPSGADVQAYSLNVTVVPKGSLRWLTVSPSNSSVDPNFVSTLNAYDGTNQSECGNRAGRYEQQ